MPMNRWSTEELSIENEWRWQHFLSTLTRSSPAKWKQQEGLGNRMPKGLKKTIAAGLSDYGGMLVPEQRTFLQREAARQGKSMPDMTVGGMMSERHGASHRVTQTLPGGTDQSAPTYANGKQVTSRRVQAPRSLMFDKEGGHDPAALGSTSQLKQGAAEVPYQNRRYRTR